MKLFRSNPVPKLRKAYEAKLLEARDTQRGGNIQKYAGLMEEAEALRRKIEESGS